MIDITLLKTPGILIVTPDGRITEADASALEAAVAGHLDGASDIHGLLIDAAHFPGYEDIAAWRKHMEIIWRCHARVGRIALVSDSGLAAAAEALGRALGVTIRHFPHATRDAALAWLSA